MKNRHSIRLPTYNYSSKGFYFITICTKNKEHVLSHIDSKGKIHLTELGTITNLYLSKTYYYLNINEYIIMPNHINMIIEIVIQDKINLGKFISTFKSKIYKKYNKSNYNKTDIWQRNYYEHIIRNNAELCHIKNYIKNNPYKWINH